MRPIVEIALDLGFGSQGHFHRAFRNETGTTPGSYRRGG
jgi:AraC-like DNA-binding protein